MRWDKVLEPLLPPLRRSESPALDASIVSGLGESLCFDDMEPKSLTLEPKSQILEPDRSENIEREIRVGVGQAACDGGLDKGLCACIRACVCTHRCDHVSYVCAWAHTGRCGR